MNTTSKLFQERRAYKPFEYPEFFNDGWLAQMQAFWLHTKIPMSGDVKDWNENLTPAEKHLVGNILMGFAQMECAVGDYWSRQVVSWFPKPEIQHMGICFGSQETVHAVAYSYLNETLGLDNFDGFLHEPTISNKLDLLMQTSQSWTWHYIGEDSTVGRRARREVARSLAVFSGFAEGVSLFSSFAVLYSFQLRNLLKGVGQQMFWSVKDECLHSTMGCRLFNLMCSEFPSLRRDVEEEVYEAAQTIVELEEAFIDKMFEQGDLVNLKTYDLKQFIRSRTCRKLEELGLTPIGTIEVDQAAADNLSWFYDMTGGVTHTDFFAQQPVDYAKPNQNENWDLWK